MSKIFVNCTVCNTVVVRQQCCLKPITFCSRNCQSNYYKIAMKGTANPNYGGKGWTEEKRASQSERTKIQMTLERRKTIGDQHCGKIMSEESRQLMSKAQKNRAPAAPITESTRTAIGLASAAKFTEEYKINQRKIMEELGYWVPLDEKDDYSLYFKFSDWVDRMFDFVINNEQLTLLNTNGVFHNINNKNGVVRDHIYSRREGFKNGVFPEIMRHPCNLQIISIGENTSKSRSKLIYNDCHQTLEELFVKIVNYKQKWKEHEICLSLIEKYKNSNRYDKNHYLKLN